MPTPFGAVRRYLLSPRLVDVTFAKRGFPAVPSAATERLEAIPQAVICGFEWGIEARGQWEVERRLDLVDTELRGFAYEGATMAFTILDATGPGRGHRARDLLRGPGRPHIFLAYIGMGFAMARLPRPLWKKAVPDLAGDPYYPTMSWLAVDGYGFDRAYFDTRRWVDAQYVPKPYPWERAPDYFLRAVDQGIGRALWFICGGRVPDAAAAVGRFAVHRQADLWSGIGLAATFAGGSDADGLAALRRASGAQWPHLAVGSVFAVKARTYSGFVPEHTRTACLALTDTPVDKAVAVADDTAVGSAAGTLLPPYEVWRRRIRDHYEAELPPTPVHSALVARATCAATRRASRFGSAVAGDPAADLRFIVTGLSTNIGALNGSALWVLVLVCVIASLGKIGPAYVAGRVGGLRPRESASVAALVNSRGLTELIALNVGLRAGIIGQQLFSLLVVMAMLMTIATVPLLRLIGYPSAPQEEASAPQEEASLDRGPSPSLPRTPST
jgi:hypothetical protein